MLASGISRWEHVGSFAHLDRGRDRRLGLQKHGCASTRSHATFHFGHETRLA